MYCPLMGLFLFQGPKGEKGDGLSTSDMVGTILQVCTYLNQRVFPCTCVIQCNYANVNNYAYLMNYACRDCDTAGRVTFKM